MSKKFRYFSLKIQIANTIFSFATTITTKLCSLKEIVVNFNQRLSCCKQNSNKNSE